MEEEIVVEATQTENSVSVQTAMDIQVEDTQVLVFPIEEIPVSQIEQKLQDMINLLSTQTSATSFGASFNPDSNNLNLTVNLRQEEDTEELRQSVIDFVEYFKIKNEVEVILSFGSL